MSEYQTLYTTIDSLEDAKELAAEVIEEKLAACVNIFPMQSFYHWDGELCEDEEYALICKTTKRVIPELKDFILESHPYESPAIVIYDIQDGSPDFFKWVESQTKAGMH